LARALSEPGAAKGGRWGDFWLRFASAAILGPVALFCVWYGGGAWQAFITVAAVGLALEWIHLAGLQNERRAVMIMVASLALAVCFARNDVPAALVILALGAALLGGFYGRFAGWGVPYAGIGAIALVWLRLQPSHGLRDTLFLVLVVWSTDIGAYVVGRLVGGAKMAPAISPGKTWSGAIGGFFAGGVAGGLLAGNFHFIEIGAMPAGFLLSFFAQGGDLLESAIKRKLGVKDSGRTIPGHGGLFDRLDGFLTAAPLAAILALIVQGGVPLWG
jgi:phosphatidate cytidylyltransferase